MKTHDTPRLTEAEAHARGLRRMTTPYTLPNERWMLDNVIADMNRGGIAHALVEAPDVRNVEVWRKPSKPSNGFNGHGNMPLMAR